MNNALALAFTVCFSQLENGLIFTLRQLLHSLQMRVWCRPSDKAIVVLEGADVEAVNKEMDSVVLSTR